MIKRSQVRFPAGEAGFFYLFIFSVLGQLSMLTVISVSVPPRVAAVARKTSKSFYQKRRWHVIGII